MTAPYLLSESLVLQYEVNLSANKAESCRADLPNSKTIASIKHILVNLPQTVAGMLTKTGA
jgi:hypothetical protein